MVRYILDAQFSQLFKQAGIASEEVVRRAGVAADLFSRDTPAVTSAEYMALMKAIGDSSNTPGLAVRLATYEGVEQFSPPIFAAYCASNGRRCIDRLAQYKPLIAPLRYVVEELGEEVTLYLEPDSPELNLPEFVVEGEFTFILHVLRRATKENIVPTTLEVAHEPSDDFRQYAAIPVVNTGINAITFRAEDLQLPFVSFNESMWNFFEPELRRRLSQLEVEDTVAARVRAALVELLPSGESSIEGVARKLKTSARTLQRQLSAEKPLSASNSTMCVCCWLSST